eukprot:195724_1
MQSIESQPQNNDGQNDCEIRNKINCLPHIGSKVNLSSDDEIYHEHIDNNYPTTNRKSKSFSHSHPYSASNKTLLSRSKSRLTRSNTARHHHNNTRPHTTKHARYPPKYSNWGMKIDSTEALREQILSLKKKCKNVSDENLLIKTEKRRMEKLLRKNDRKLKRLLNTVSNKKSLINDPKMNHDTAMQQFLNDDTRKYATTELLDMLNVAHNSNITLKRTLQKTKEELKSTHDTITHLQKQKKEIESRHDLQLESMDELQSHNDNELIQHLETQLAEYKEEIVQCHQIFDTLTKSNEESLQKINETDEYNAQLNEENMELKLEIE